MAAKEFGKLVSDRMEELGLSQRRLAARMGELPDGSLYDATSIRTVREGQRRLTHELISRLIDILGLDPDEAWAASGLLPPGVSAEELRQLRRFRADVVARQPRETTRSSFRSFDAFEAAA